MTLTKAQLLGMLGGSGLDGYRARRRRGRAADAARPAGQPGSGVPDRHAVAGPRAASSSPGMGTRGRCAGPGCCVLVLAGGRGSRLGPLTTGRAKPSLPVGGHYRLIDVALLERRAQRADRRLGARAVRAAPAQRASRRRATVGPGPHAGRLPGAAALRGLRPGRIRRRQRRRARRELAGDRRALARRCCWSAAPTTSSPSTYRDVVAAHLDSADEVTIVTTVLPRGSDASRYLVVRHDVSG